MPSDFEPKRIDDLLEMKVKKGVISGRGENPFYGQFRVTGSDSPRAATLAYRGEGGGENLPGVALLIKSADGNELAGLWWQYAKNSQVIGGTVGLKRV